MVKAGGPRKPVIEAFRPHDLLWLSDPASLVAPGPLPSWANPQWLAAAPVVVRREAVADPTLVPVGLRGTTRTERCAAYASASQVRRILTPEEIARDGIWHHDPYRSRLPALRALARLAPLLRESGLTWGVTGGVGFRLATGLDVLRPDSDLDLLIRAPSRLDKTAIAALAASLECALSPVNARIDIQVETASGAFFLKEWLSTNGPVLLKTALGPVLTADPWTKPGRSGPPGGSGGMEHA